MKKTLTINNRLERVLKNHSDLEGLARTSLKKAIEIGGDLAIIKKSLGHGKWMPWCKANIPFSKSTIENYRRLYDNSSKFPTVGNFSITDAYKLLSQGTLDDDKIKQKDVIKEIPKSNQSSPPKQPNNNWDDENENYLNDPFCESFSNHLDKVEEMGGKDEYDKKEKEVMKEQKDIYDERVSQLEKEKEESSPRDVVARVIDTPENLIVGDVCDEPEVSEEVDDFKVIHMEEVVPVGVTDQLTDHKAAMIMAEWLSDNLYGMGVTPTHQLQGAVNHYMRVDSIKQL